MNAAESVSTTSSDNAARAAARALPLKAFEVLGRAILAEENPVARRSLELALETLMASVAIVSVDEQLTGLSFKYTGEHKRMESHEEIRRWLEESRVRKHRKKVEAWLIHERGTVFAGGGHVARESASERNEERSTR